MSRLCTYCHFPTSRDHTDCVPDERRAQVDAKLEEDYLALAKDILASSDPADALMKAIFDPEAVDKQIKLREQREQELVEAAYWKMDAIKRGYGQHTPMTSERDAFKAAARWLLTELEKPRSL